MEWNYDPRQRCWRRKLNGWLAQIERWPASLEYLAQLTSSVGTVVRAPHVFTTREAAERWCQEETALLQGH